MREERAADVLGEGEIGVEVAGVEPVVENAADAARFAAMLQKEILVAPGLEFVVGRDRGVGVAGSLHRGVERDRVGIVLGAPAIKHRRQIGAAAEPRFCRDDETRVHMHRRHVRIVHVGDQRNAGGEKTRIVGGAGNVLAEFRGEFAEHGRDVNADLLEHAAFHHRHDAAAARCAGMIGAVPGRALKAARRRDRQSGAPAGRASSSASKARDDLVAQGLEPGCGRGFCVFRSGLASMIVASVLHSRQRSPKRYRETVTIPARIY